MHGVPGHQGLKTLNQALGAVAMYALSGAQQAWPRVHTSPIQRPRKEYETTWEGVITHLRVSGKVSDMMQETMVQEPLVCARRNDYETFWESFGRNIKLGCIEDQANKETLAALLRFPSSKSDEDMTGLADYVARWERSLGGIVFRRMRGDGEPEHSCKNALTGLLV